MLFNRFKTWGISKIISKSKIKKMIKNNKYKKELEFLLRNPKIPHSTSILLLNLIKIKFKFNKNKLMKKTKIVIKSNKNILYFC